MVALILRDRLFIPVAISVIGLALLSFSVGYGAYPSSRETLSWAPAIGAEGKGLLVPFSLTAYKGTGRLLVNIENARFKEDTEHSLLDARSHVEKLYGVSFGSRDVVFEVKQKTEAVAGESAGAAFAVAFAANWLGVQPRQDAVISAALNESGELQPVGGIDEKILAAADGDKTLFVIADSQELKYENELVEKIRVERVKTLSEAIRILLG